MPVLDGIRCLTGWARQTLISQTAATHFKAFNRSSVGTWPSSGGPTAEGMRLSATGLTSDLKRGLREAAAAVRHPYG